MINKNTHSLVSSILATGLLAAGLIFASATLACTDSFWEGVETGGATATGDWVTDNFPRVSGLCSLQATGVGQVHDKRPVDEATMFGRFMFLPNNLAGNPGEVVIFEAFSDDAGTALVFTISYDGTSIIMRSGGNNTSVAADPAHWNMIAFAFDNTGNSSLWVSSDRKFDIDVTPAHGTVDTSGTDSIFSVILGLPDGLDTFTGSAQFDDFESRRTTQPGMPDKIGDGNNDGNIDSIDFLNVLDEIFQVSQGAGQTDCNLDGAVDSIDFLCILDVIFNP